jgi:two-component system, NtrC family, sensor kinase
LVIFLIALVLGAAFTRSLTLPLKALAEQTEVIARGEYSRVKLDHTAQRRDEVGTFARSFYKMSQDLEKTQEDLRRADRLAAMGQMGAFLAHGLKNPLASTLANSDLLKSTLLCQDCVAKPPVQKAFGYIKSETQQASRIVTDLMKFARNEKRPETQMNLTDEIHEALNSLAPVLEKAHVQVQKQIIPQSLMCLGNRDEIKEVVSNLIENAVHAMKEKSENSRYLKVELKEKDQYSCLTLTDSGSGMSEATAAKIFEPFFTTKKVGEGTGLGLAVCHGIISSHKGKITVRSELGVGTTFEILLPRLDSGAASS